MGRDLVAKLYAMAEQTESPREAETARRALVRLGYPPVVIDPRATRDPDEVLNKSDIEALLAFLSTRPDD